MPTKHKMSLLSAILININIIAGAGLFLNIKVLTKLASAWGFLGYVAGTIILLPFVYSIGKLAQLHPVSGGLYAYPREYLSPFIGFTSAWSYFVGKSVSAAFLSFAFAQFLHTHIPFLGNYSPLTIACAVIFSLIAFNIAGVHVGGKIQYIFFSVKIIPILFVLIFGALTFKTYAFTAQTIYLPSIFATIPIALYPMLGFETSCSIAHLIKNPEKNTLKAITYSFGLVAFLYIAFQAILYGAVGEPLASDVGAFSLLAQVSLPRIPLLGKFITSLVFTSVIAGAFGILTSNCWNIKTLFDNNHLPGKKFFCHISTHNVPIPSLIFEGTLAAIMLLISKNQIALQSMVVFSLSISFCINSVAAFVAVKRKLLKGLPIIIPTLAIGGSSYMLFLCMQNLTKTGVSTSFLSILLSGLLIAFAQNHLLSFRNSKV